MRRPVNHPNSDDVENAPHVDVGVVVAPRSPRSTLRPLQRRSKNYVALTVMIVLLGVLSWAMMSYIVPVEVDNYLLTIGTAAGEPRKMTETTTSLFEQDKSTITADGQLVLPSNRMEETQETTTQASNPTKETATQDSKPAQETTTQDSAVDTTTQDADPVASCIGKPSGDCTAPRGSQRPVKSVVRTAELEDRYITLWLHQVHRWFAPRNGQESNTQIRVFLQAAKDAGFTSVMTDLPWDWTEREGPGDVRIETFGKDWMGIACEIGLELHVVVSMRNFPPWLDKNATEDHRYEVGVCEHSEGVKTRDTIRPSFANPHVWDRMQQYLVGANKALMSKYGSCIRSLSPSQNPEFETKYAPALDSTTDYSKYMKDEYAVWQAQKFPSRSTPYEASLLSCDPRCQAITDKATLEWLAFREEFLGSRYERLCELVHNNRVVTESGKTLTPNCLLHFGEFFSTVDQISGSVFFQLAKSPYIDELVLDSNMALNGAPSSPSVIGILISTAQGYGKIVHYEAATERIMKCDDEGELTVVVDTTGDTGSVMLLKSGMMSALDAGVQSIGVTNLCRPSLVRQLFDSFSTTNDHIVQTGLPYHPTAVIFVPYQAFYSWKYVVAGSTCDRPAIPCWHDSLATVETFGHGKLNQVPNTCAIDSAQDILVQVWDELRTRHDHVLVVGDVEQLTDTVLTAAQERVYLKFPCLMDGEKWRFFGGEASQEKFASIKQRFSFQEQVVDTLDGGPCTLDS